jgi:hypothetical protein
MRKTPVAGSVTTRGLGLRCIGRGRSRRRPSGSGCAQARAAATPGSRAGRRCRRAVRSTSPAPGSHRARARA